MVIPLTLCVAELTKMQLVLLVNLGHRNLLTTQMSFNH